MRESGLVQKKMYFITACLRIKTANFAKGMCDILPKLLPLLAKPFLQKIRLDPTLLAVVVGNPMLIAVRAMKIGQLH